LAIWRSFSAIDVTHRGQAEWYSHGGQRDSRSADHGTGDACVARMLEARGRKKQASAYDDGGGSDRRHGLTGSVRDEASAVNLSEEGYRPFVEE
jgi:hypothetical protein